LPEKNDTIVSTAIQNNGLSIQYAPQDIRGMYNIVLLAVQNNGIALEYASNDLKKIPTIVLAAVQNNGIALKFAPEFSNHYDIVLAAVSNDGLAFRYASFQLKDNYNIVKIALCNNSYVRYYVTEFKYNQTLKLEVVQKNGELLSWFFSDGVFGYRFCNDRTLVSLAVITYGNILSIVSKELRDDFDIVLTAVSNNDHSLQFASSKKKYIKLY
jgi:hypothetical protein